MKSLDKVRTLLDQADAEASDFQDGNKSAGTRLRGVMQEIRRLCKDVRSEVLEIRRAEKAKSKKTSGKKKVKVKKKVTK